MTLWYPIVNATSTLAGAFGSLNSAISGNVLGNGDWFWTMIMIAVFFTLFLVFMRNQDELMQSMFVSSVICLVLSSILFSIGIVFIVIPLVFVLMTLVSMSFSIANKSPY